MDDGRAGRLTAAAESTTAEPEPESSRPLIRVLGITVLASAAAFVSLYALMPILGSRGSLMPLFLAVLSAAWLGRIRAALLTTVLATIGADLLLFPPVGSVLIDATADHVRLALFVFTCLSISMVTEAMHRSRDRAQRQERAIRADFQARLQTEQELRDSEERFRTLAESIPQLAWAAHPDGSIYWFNRRWYEYTGTTLEQMQGMGWTSVHDPDVLPLVLQRYMGGMREGRPLDMTFPIRGADGKYRPFFTLVYPLKDANGAVIQWFGTNTDVSEQRALEERLREEDRRKDEFLATLAHELRNPLAPLRTGLQVLRHSGMDPNESSRTWEMMDRQLTHMARLLDDLLDVSRITRGKMELRKRRVSLSEVLETSLETARPLIEAAGHTLSVRTPPDPIEFEADPVRLAQVFTNLLNNAAKYTERGGHIDVDVRRDGFQAVVSVRDSGAGIPASALPKIFDLFAHGVPSIDRTQGGLGIGLSLVKNLVEMHGGTVMAQSDGPGRGSMFVVRLPVAVDAPVSIGAADVIASARPSPSEGLRILVADDNRDAAESLSMMLELMGHEVRMASDGEQAVATAAEFRPHVAVLDIGMPKLNGFDACRAIRQQPDGSRILLVALTGWGQPDDRRQSEQAGFNAHLVKPMDADALLRMIASVQRTA